ncbi:MAG: translational GTPase TypA [Actinobacteria bacterium]|nr:translational GTPase TypA [Actinomycetota bacterium]
MNGGEPGGQAKGVMLQVRSDIRNIAIIAHVDHGKTTLVDGLLRQAHTFRDNQAVGERVMDSNELERERGITILSKNTAVTYRGVRINIVDTPGHADFGGEVERVMNMVDGVLLLVDAAEGPMPQTRFVLRKALQMGHKAIVVINKVDRKNADPDAAVNKTFDLFIELGADDRQSEFPIIYTNALTQQAGVTPELGSDLQPLFEAILEHIPAPRVDPDAPLQVLLTTLGYDEYKGVIAVGRIFAGRISIDQAVTRIDVDGVMTPARVRYLYIHQGLQRVVVNQAEAGEIVAIGGIENVGIGETIADADHHVALPTIRIEEPTVRMTFGVNTGPLAGREGRWGTSRKLRQRLFEETVHNVALRVEETDSADTFLVAGRGELQLAILIETMRREGYEFQVSRPEVIFKEGEAGETLEPYEEVHLEVPEAHVGTVVDLLGQRRGQMTDLVHASKDGTAHLTYIVPTRGLLGFRYQFLTSTKGTGVMNTIFHGYLPMAGKIEDRPFGSLVAWEAGQATAFGLKNAEERGRLFIEPGTEVYEGMVIGQYARPGDLTINVAKKKHLTNVRSSPQDVEVRLAPPRRMSLDEAIEYLGEDELLEVTPESYRIRKRILSSEERGKTAKRAKELEGLGG